MSIEDLRDGASRLARQVSPAALSNEPPDSFRFPHVRFHQAAQRIFS